MCSMYPRFLCSINFADITHPVEISSYTGNIVDCIHEILDESLVEPDELYTLIDANITIKSES